MLVRRQRRKRFCFAYVRLISEADHPRKAKALTARPINDCRAERPRMRNQPDSSRFRHRGFEKGRVERQMSVNGPNTVGTEKTNAKRVRRFRAFPFERRPFRAHFSESRRNHDGGFNPAPRARFKRTSHCRRRDNENRQINGVGDFFKAEIKGMPEKFPLFLADEMYRARVLALDKVARRAVSQFFGGGGDADDNDASRRKEGEERVAHLPLPFQKMTKRHPLRIVPSLSDE